MKKTLVSIFFAVFIFGCSEKKAESGPHARRSPTYELYNGDTINRTDANGNKQGIWINFKHEGIKIDTVKYKDGIEVK